MVYIIVADNSMQFICPALANREKLETFSISCVFKWQKSDTNTESDQTAEEQ